MLFIQLFLMSLIIIAWFLTLIHCRCMFCSVFFIMMFFFQIDPVDLIFFYLQKYHHHQNTECLYCKLQIFHLLIRKVVIITKVAQLDRMKFYQWLTATHRVTDRERDCEIPFEWISHKQHFISDIQRALQSKVECTICCFEGQ